MRYTEGKSKGIYNVMGYTKQEWLNRRFQKGDRIEIIDLIDMKTVPAGTRGTVQGVDKAGNVLMLWDNGSTLPIFPEKDKYKRISE